MITKPADIHSTLRPATTVPALGLGHIDICSR